MDPRILKKTQDTLGKIIKKPPLTEKLLSKPPFRFLHDVMTSVIKTTGFMNGLFKDEELNSENVKDKDSKIAFLQKAVDFTSMVVGKSLSVKPAKIVAGHEPEKTNEFLQSLAAAINKGVDNDEYVAKMNKGGGEGKEEKRDKSKESSREDRKKRDSEDKKDRDKSASREKSRERHRDKEGHKDREDRHKDKEDRHKDDEDRHRDKRDRHRDRESRHKDKDDKDKEDRHKDREERHRDRKERRKAQNPSLENAKSSSLDTDTSDMDPSEEESQIDAAEQDTAYHSIKTSETNLVSKIRRPGAARIRAPSQVEMRASAEGHVRRGDITVTSSENEQTPSSCEQLNTGKKETEMKGMTASKTRKTVRQRDAIVDPQHGGSNSRPAVRKTGKDEQHDELHPKMKGGRAGKTDAKKSDQSDGRKDYQKVYLDQPHEKSKKKAAVRSVQNCGKSGNIKSSKDREHNDKMNKKDSKFNEKLYTKGSKHTDKSSSSNEASSIDRGTKYEEPPKFLPREHSVWDHKYMDEKISKKREQGIQRDWKNTERMMHSHAVDKMRKSSRKELEGLEESDHQDEESKENDPSQMNGEKEEAPTKLARPSSAKGSRRRREGRRHSSDEEDEPPKTLQASDAGDDSLPPQVSASRSLARPSSARPAPPRRKQEVIENEPAMRLGSGKPSNVIVDGDKDSDEEEDETFMVEETAAPQEQEQAPPPPQDEDEDEDHGGLVKKMLETKKELESGSQGKKTEIERPKISDAQRMKQRQQVQKEIDKLRVSIQTLTRSANPLGKVMDYVQEDLDSMQKELQRWKQENKEHALELKRERSITDKAIEPLRAQLTEVDQAIKDQLDLIAAVKSNIIRNDQKIDKMLRSIAKS